MGRRRPGTPQRCVAPRVSQGLRSELKAPVRDANPTLPEEPRLVGWVPFRQAWPAFLFFASERCEAGGQGWHATPAKRQCPSPPQGNEILRRGEESCGLGIWEKRGEKHPLVLRWAPPRITLALGRGWSPVQPRGPRPGSRGSRDAAPSTASGGGVGAPGKGGGLGEICIFKNGGSETTLPRRQASCDVQHNVLLKYRNPPPNGGSCSLPRR